MPAKTTEVLSCRQHINNFRVGLRVIPGVTNVNKGDYAYKDRNFVVALRGTYTFQKKE